MTRATKRKVQPSKGPRKSKSLRIHRRGKEAYRREVLYSKCPNCDRYPSRSSSTGWREPFSKNYGKCPYCGWSLKKV